MAYGMSSAELAKVGKNVNDQGSDVDEQSIRAAMDSELTEDRKEQIGRFGKRRKKSVAEDAKRKAELRKNMMKAVAKSGIEVAGALDEGGAFDKKADGPEIAPVQVKAGMRDNLLTGKPAARLSLSGPTRKGPDIGSEEYARQSAKGLRQIKRMGRRSKGDGSAETDSELLALLGD
tara:strand:+ start:5255 stop:5782 length:528 start_codon:yes stop_codon:yes gene_type:complete